ncbi:MAG: enoyl-CoA hydratase/isomerase family protein [Sphingomonadales bacterium]|jgi:enoyl-CoA hydratase/carnithine racemase|nr:enoyl-CoA hydratase/isomerase family protein [Sphingomonadales bacterium]MBK9004890.1 enoyl-CoA hydratase/isomerase family protein [Sphingomonadales bacterium]MBK9267380.1 enoyl-CoA hydratase/isomerase family protein [Sphingomonadales bacterium]
MEYRHLVVSRDGHVVTCQMSNPPLQTLNSRMLAELHDLLTQIEADPDVRVFVVTGENGVFLRWMDLNEMQAYAEGAKDQTDGGPSQAEELLEIYRAIPSSLSRIHELALRIQNLPAVTIAAINGVVGGGGCEFSLSFDFRLMMDHPEGSFALPQTSFGLVPGGGGAWHCVRLLGRARALDVLLHGEFMSPATALELGLISRLYAPETFDADVAAFVANMAARAPLALRGVKALVNVGTSQGQLEFLARETVELGKVIHSEDVKGALAMWLSNPDPAAYKPVFEGR